MRCRAKTCSWEKAGNKVRLIVGSIKRSLQNTNYKLWEMPFPDSEFDSQKGTIILLRNAITNKRLARCGYYDISKAYKSLLFLIEPSCTDRLRGGVERLADHLMVSLLLDCVKNSSVQVFRSNIR